MYFLLGILTFFAVSVLLLRRKMFVAIKQGYFAMATVHVVLGGIDFLGKIGGVPDILAPLRSAHYAMVTGVDIVGIWRIAGAYSEASGFGGATVALLAFTFTYWKLTRHRHALGLAIALLVLLLLSELPNIWVKRAAEAKDLRKVRIGLVIMSLIPLAAFVTRGFEYDHLNVGWDRNAYGSITWALLLMHTVHLVTDWVDTLVLAALMHTDHGIKDRRFVDTSENALYWHFIVGSWVLVYAVIYWVPRLSQ